jgi:hypothetical protein
VTVFAKSLNAPNRVARRRSRFVSYPFASVYREGRASINDFDFTNSADRREALRFEPIDARSIGRQQRAAFAAIENGKAPVPRSQRKPGHRFVVQPQTNGGIGSPRSPFFGSDAEGPRGGNARERPIGERKRVRPVQRAHDRVLALRSPVRSVNRGWCFPGEIPLLRSSNPRSTGRPHSSARCPRPRLGRSNRATPRCCSARRVSEDR